MELRTGEIDGLTWDKVDFEGKQLIIDRSLGKDGELGPTKPRSSVRVVDMSNAVHEALMQQYKLPNDKSDFVFHTPSNRLPLAMNRRIANRPPSNQLQLPLLCWHDEPPKFIPTRSTYIMLNTVTATIGGIAVSPISFNWRKNMNSATNAGTVKLCQRDYEKIISKIRRTEG